jgi:glyoxylase-like metal-dependent hydrolase (beta-lactamase superfamily II)
MGIERRLLFRAGSALAAAAVIGITPQAQAFADAAPAGGRNAGFYRLKLGSIEVTVISDGTIGFPPSLWTAPLPEVNAALAAEARSTEEVVFQLNTTLINTGGKLVLIDTGTGGKLQDASGALIANLAAAGYRPEQVDMVLFTHGHPDHLWGVTDKATGTLLFPNAEYVGSATELKFWSDPALPGQVPAGMRAMVDTTQQHLKLISSRFRPIKAGAEIVPGITSIDTPGHTPGHISFHVGSGNAGLLVSGDVVANATLSFRRPEWGYAFDADAAQAAKTRIAFLDRCVADNALVASYHLPFPAVGHVVRDGAAYRWLPAEWRWTA